MDSGSQLSVGDAERCRVEELLRVNTRLAAEVRSLALGRTEAPRPGKMTAPRKIGALTEERDALTERLAAAGAELTALREHVQALEQDRDALAAEVRRLRAGWPGLARRARARLFGR